MGCLSNLIFKGSGILWKQHKLGKEQEGMEDIKETRSSKHSTTDTHMNAQDLHRSAPDGAPVLREVDTSPIPISLTQKLFPADSHLLSFLQWSLTGDMNQP